MDGIKKSTATAILILIAVACGNPTDADLTASIGTVSSAGTTFTIADDSEWQIPSGFRVVPPPTRKQVDEMLANDVGAPPDLPAFSMTRESETNGELESVVIAVYSDGVSSEARPKEVLESWFNSIRRADFDVVIVMDRIGLQLATSRGQGQGHTQNSPQGIILTVITNLETQKVWRLSCFVSSKEVSDEVARVCQQVADEFRSI